MAPSLPSSCTSLADVPSMPIAVPAARGEGPSLLFAALREGPSLPFAALRQGRQGRHHHRSMGEGGGGYLAFEMPYM